MNRKENRNIEESNVILINYYMSIQRLPETDKVCLLYMEKNLQQTTN
jgi:hypothetical protein